DPLFATRQFSQRFHDALHTRQIGLRAGAHCQAITLRIKRHAIGRLPARRGRIAKRLLDMRKIAMQRAEHRLGLVAEDDDVGEIALRTHDNAIARTRSPDIEPCVAASTRTSTISPGCAALSSKCTPCKYGERPCFWPSLRPSPVTRIGNTAPI